MREDAAKPTLVRLSGPEGLCVHGVLKGASHRVIHIQTSVALVPGTRVAAILPFCLPILGEVAYSKPAGISYRTAVFFHPQPAKPLQIGQEVSVDALCVGSSSGQGRVLDRAQGSVSILCSNRAELGAWVRIESEESILFGEVVGILPVDRTQRVVGMQIDAAFPKAKPEPQPLALAASRSR